MNPWSQVIQIHGWAIVKVPELELAYSIGLQETFDHPEIAITGLPIDTAHQLINAVGELIRAGASFDEGDETEPGVLLEGYACAFRRVHASRFETHLGQLLEHGSSRSVDALQCCWPDANGAFPWSDDALSWLKKAQERLYEATE